MSALLDTCFLSELARREPDRGVLAWLAGQDERGLYLSALTLGELHRGARQVAEATRRRRLEAWIERDVVNRFGNRVLPVDSSVALRWGDLHAEARARGTVLPAIDSLIAATALVHSLAVVTRNSSDFQRTGVPVVDPWTTG